MSCNNVICAKKYLSDNMKFVKPQIRIVWNARCVKDLLRVEKKNLDNTSDSNVSKIKEEFD